MSQQINLFNPIFLRQQKMFSLLTMVQALGLIILGSGFFYGYARYQVEQLTSQSTESDRRFKTGQDSLARYTSEFSPQEANKLLQDEVQNLEQQNLKQAKIVDTLKSGALGNTTGYSAYMQAFSRQVIEGLWLTGFSVKGNGAHITLNGSVLKPELLPAYIQRLNRETVMQGKTFSTLQMQQPVLNEGKEAEQARVRIAAKVEVIESDWRLRHRSVNPATPEEESAHQRALLLAYMSVKQPVLVDHIEFSLQSEEENKQKIAGK
jgi:hypothetical protein